MNYYLAIDIGASSGRHMLGYLEEGHMKLEEIYRFPNGMKSVDGSLCWDVEELFFHIKEGMKKCKEAGKIPVAMGIDQTDSVCKDRYPEADLQHDLPAEGCPDAGAGKP